MNWKLKARYIILVAGVLGIAALLIGSYAMLLVREGENADEEREKLENSLEVAWGERGCIYDCNGHLISASAPMCELSMDVTVFFDRKGNLKDFYKENIDIACRVVAEQFREETASELRRRIEKGVGESASYSKKHNGKHKHVKLVKRLVTLDDAKELEKKEFFRKGNNMSGLVISRYPKRFNMFNDEAKRVVGEFDIKSGVAKYGLELYYDSVLRGEPGTSIKTQIGKNKIPVLSEEPVDGQDLVLTIDMDIQDMAESIMRDKVALCSASLGCMIVMEVETGEIKAMVNILRDSTGFMQQGSNYCVVLSDQPGSTFKTVCMMAALEEGLVSPDEEFDVNYGMPVIFGPGEKISDSHRYSKQFLTANEIMMYSSNIGMARIVNKFKNNKAGRRRFIDAVKATGFAHRLEIEAVNAEYPTIYDPDSVYDKRTYSGWSNPTMRSMSRGYEVKSTPLYTLNFYNAIANDGYYVEPHLVKEFRRGGEVVTKVEPLKIGKRMCSPGTLDKIRNMLRMVAQRDGGTACNSLKGLNAAGKTGTAQLHRRKDGSFDGYQLSFAGYYPADEPKYSCIVVLYDCPQMKTGIGCVDAFRQIMTKL